MKSQRTSLIFILSFLGIILTSCSSSKTPYLTMEGEKFNTTYRIIYQSDKDLTEDILQTIDYFEQSLNNFNPNSLISMINKNETNVVDSMLKKVITTSQKISYETSGVYDITGSPYFQVWGFGTKKDIKELPTQEMIDSISEFVGYDKISIISDSIVQKKDPRVSVHAVSLSKGYLCDLISYTLDNNNVSNYLIEFGGEIVCKGMNAKNHCWNIGINKPIEDSTSTIQDVQYVISLCDHKSLATSGDYRNYKIVEGKKVAHTINASTGQPAHENILSATVLAPTCIEADAWATAFMAIGYEKALRILDTHPELSVIFSYVDNDNSIKTYTRGVTIEPYEQ